jgi:putative acetyltransferase
VRVEQPRIAQEVPDQEEIRTLLQLSDAFAASLYPPESNHLVPGDALMAANARFLVARLQARAVGCGALILGSNGEAEIKRMFVIPDGRRRGVGQALLMGLEAAARRDNVQVVRLETGVKNCEALTLYRRNGYRERGPFGDYRPDPLSVFMEKTLVGDYSAGAGARSGLA